MKNKKTLIIILIIWLMGIPVTLVLANFLIGVPVGYFLNEDGTLMKYAEKAEVFLHPEKSPRYINDGKIAPSLVLRNMIQDYDLVVKIASVIDIEGDKCFIFDEKNTDSSLESGNFAIVIKAPDADGTPNTDSIGIISIDEFVNESFTDALIMILADNQGAKIRLDKYAIKDFVISPVKLSVLDNSGKAIATFNTDNIPSGYTVIEEDNVYIYNYIEPNRDMYISDTYNVYANMLMAKNQDRITKKLAKSYYDGIDYNAGSANNIDSVKIGFASCKYVGVNVSGDKAMVLVSRVTYPKTMLLATASLFVLYTIIVALFSVFVLLKKKKSN